MRKGDRVVYRRGRAELKLVVDEVEKGHFKGRDPGGWFDWVVLRSPNGRRLRVKRGILEESPNVSIQGALF
jgi:hypothetical protein